MPLTQAVSPRPAAPAGGVSPDGPRDTTPDGSPVFVDATGRRQRLARRIGLVAGAVLVVFLGALGIGAATGAAVPGTPWNAPSTHPDGGHQSAGARAAKPTGGREGGTSSKRPRTVPSGGSAKAPSATSQPASTTAPAPSASTAPSAKPTASTTASRPGNSHASPPAWGHTKKPS
ncbi:hypothetical protein [Actinomadura sp. NPDC048394]|uniref:hypothetical protein n=1 Tax=Actinomadura sp. NPDC048394 TaxID=3158223 RepID=UPI0033E584A6